MKETLKFLRDLGRNNNREWFAAHKEKYLDIKQRVETLCGQLIDVLSEIEPEAAYLKVSDCTYRIYRDTRFSADKTPYKTHIGLFLNPGGGKKALKAGYYLHIEPGNCFFAPGSWGLPSNMVRVQREAVFKEIDDYREIVEDPEFKKYFKNLGFDNLKTSPKGFPKDWEYVEYLRPRHFCASAPLEDSFVSRKDLAERMRPMFGQAKRFVDFVNYPLDPEQDDYHVG